MTKKEALAEVEAKEMPLSKWYVKGLISSIIEDKPCRTCKHCYEDEYCEECKFNWDSNFELEEEDS